MKAGESFIITAGLEKLGASENPPPLRLEASNEKDIIVKVDELARQVKEGLNLTPTQIAGDIEKEVGKVTTSSPEALKYYTEGRRHQWNVEHEQALAFLEKAVEIDPDFAMAYRAMGAAQSGLGHEAEMRKCYKKALDLSDHLPDNERLLIEAIWLDVEDNYAKAIDVLERLVKTYPGHLQGNFWLAYTFASIGDSDKSIERYEFCIQNLRTAVSVGNLAFEYMAKGLYQKTEDVCRSFLQDVEDNGYVRNQLFYSYLCRRQFDSALAEAEKFYLLGPQWSKGAKGIVLFCKDDFAGAEKILVDYDSQFNLLLAWGRINDTIGLSQRNLEKSKGDKAKEANAYRGLVRALGKNGLYDRAYQAFAQYLKLSADYHTESDLPIRLGQQEGDLFAKGTLQAEMKSFDEARKSAEALKSLVDNSTNKKALRYYEYILGLIELEKKNYRQAANLFDSACGHLYFERWANSENASFLDPLARSLYESGELERARKTYEKITLLTIGRFADGDIYAKAFYMLGKIAEQQGDKTQARENYRKFLDLWKDADPGLPEVADAKRRLAAL